ncbi:MAG: hypothetical protein RL226_2346, partial [Bacteroidota bacterium]
MASGSFKTIKAPSESLYKVKGSKHLGFAYPIRKEEQVKELVDALRKEHFG